MAPTDFLNPASFGFQNGNGLYGEPIPHREGDTSRVLTFKEVNEQKPDLGRILMTDCGYLHIDQKIIKAVRTIDHEGNLLPTHLGIEIGIGGNLMRAAMMMEIGYVDGAQRVWDGRLIILPGQLVTSEGEMPITPLMREIGYHVLIKNPVVSNSMPMVRNDSLCVPSMVDGHFASAEDIHIGCDCEPQRHEAQRLIHENPGGGVSLLAPYSGRGNGTHPHIGQLMSQNVSVRYNIAYPPTLTAYEEQGFRADSRPDYYWIDAMMLQMCGITEFRLLTNNPDKANILTEFGLKVVPQTFHIKSRREYYEAGLNFQQKVGSGGHKDYHE